MLMSPTEGEGSLVSVWTLWMKCNFFVCPLGQIDRFLLNFRVYIMVVWCGEGIFSRVTQGLFQKQNVDFLSNLHIIIIGKRCRSD